MPAYYTNPYAVSYPINYSGNGCSNQMVQQPQYMINVDGEAAAKSWQPMFIPQPNTIIPLFDSDGQHVYFRSYDAYGRMNPLRKGQIVFEEEVQASGAVQVSDATVFATKEDIDGLKQELQELKQMFQSRQGQNNQNGNNFRGDKR